MLGVDESIIGGWKLGLLLDVWLDELILELVDGSLVNDWWLGSNYLLIWVGRVILVSGKLVLLLKAGGLLLIGKDWLF